MQLKLSDKIKHYRKDMELTQEGLAEAIGVTVGAVSKWENGNTVPDIMTLMQLANYFNVSMDELLGFDLTSKNIDDMCKSISELCTKHEFDQAELEAKNAMQRYPHNFKVLYECADMYYFKYLARQGQKDAEKAITFFNSALNHISQNTDNEINDYVIKSKIAYLYSGSDPEKAIEQLKEINYEGNNNNSIAIIYANMGKLDEALEYFTHALIKSFSEQLNVIFNLGGVLSIQGKKSDAEKALDMVGVELDLVKASAVEGDVNYTYKMRSALYIVKACLHSRLGETAEMEECVRKAYKLATAFDNAFAPLELAESIKFFFTKQKIYSRDTTGVGAVQGIDSILTVRIKDTKGKSSKPVMKVRDYWEKVKEENKEA